MNLQIALGLPGWSSQEELTYLAQTAAKSKMIVEIGSWRGRSARAIADNTDGRIFCVDTWDDNARGDEGWWTSIDPIDLHWKPNWLFFEFQKNLGEHIHTKITQVRLTSVQAAEQLAGNRFDMIFIDAGHDYKSIREDILAWRPLLAPGGILCGHDFSAEHPAVEEVVRELVPEFRLVGTIWTTEL